MKNFKFLLLVFLVSCGTTKVMEENDVQDKLIEMHKEGCFGKCPVYSIVIFKNGYTEFLGKENTFKVGKHTLVLSKDKMKDLKAEIKKADLFQFENYYKSDIPDLPNITISYYEKDSIKTIVGKRERPSQVHKIQFYIEQIAESNIGWESVNGFVPEEQDQFDFSKIVIELKEGSQLTRWFNEVRDTLTIRIVEQADNSYDKWVISYNQNRFSADEILKRLKADSNILSVEFLKINP